MQLDTGIRGLRHDRLNLESEPLLRAPDVDTQFTAARPDDLLVQVPVPGIRGHILEYRVGRRNSRKNSDENKSRADRIRFLLGLVQYPAQIFLIAGQAVSGHL